MNYYAGGRFMASRKIIKSKHFFEENVVEYVAEVSEDNLASWPHDEQLTYVGKPVPRIDGYDKVSGTARYAFDVSFPNMAFAKTLRCPYAHARIKSINLKKASQLEGVLDIITYQNTSKIEWYYVSFLFDPHLRYEGDEVACVAAESEAIAAKALELIDVEYEQLPFVLTADQAMKADASKLYDSGNIVRDKPSEYTRGDVEQGFKEADFVVEDTFETQVEVHNPTEPHSSVVNWEGNRLTVWDSTQGIFSVREGIARALEIPESKIRVIMKYMGGGFGSKLETGKYTVMAAILARNTGRPVRISLDRVEMNLAVGNRPNSIQKLKAGIKKDGTLTALSHHSRGVVGAYPTGAGCSWPLRTIYKCSNVYTEEYSVCVNAGRARPFRAPGHVQGIFGLESLLDEAAEKIGMDPLELRLKNYAEKDQVENLPYSSKLLKKAYMQGAEAFGWKKKWKPAGSNKGAIKRGVGLASQIWWGAGGPPTYVTLQLSGDGSVLLQCGTQDIGGGTYTFMAQVAAEELEIPIDKIQVILGDTSNCPYGPSSGGSQTASSVSPAVRDAAAQMIEKLISGAAAILEVPADRLIYSQGVISYKENPNKKIKIEDIIGKMDAGVMVVTGLRAENKPGYAMNSFGVQFAEVDVDTVTGKVKVLKIVAAHDIGRTLNRMLLENQFHGGIIQGLGFALMEQRVINAYTGKVLTTNLHDYKIPTIKNAPDIEVIIVSEGDPIISNTGVKGIGEPAMIPTAGAIGNAVYNALGVRIRSLPITPDKVLMALNT
jgi:xanthine dehydrogenase YagR molybdenum-binding subunit